jgi:hypothetical protein
MPGWRGLKYFVTADNHILGTSLWPSVTFARIGFTGDANGSHEKWTKTLLSFVRNANEYLEINIIMTGE